MEQAKRGLLLVVFGPAGVGKGTIDGILLSRHEDMVLSVSATTRGIRPGEKDGVHYHFISEEAFRRMIEQDAFLEHMHVFGLDYYGTPRAFVEENLAAGRDVILEIDVQGAMRIRERCPEAVLVFIAPPSMEELKRRLVGRGTETPDKIEKRFATAAAELSYIPRYDYVVVNAAVDEAVMQMEAIVSAEKRRVCRNGALAQALIG